MMKLKINTILIIIFLCFGILIQQTKESFSDVNVPLSEELIFELTDTTIGLCKENSSDSGIQDSVDADSREILSIGINRVKSIRLEMSSLAFADTCFSNASILVQFSDFESTDIITKNDIIPCNSSKDSLFRFEFESEKSGQLNVILETADWCFLVDEMRLYIEREAISVTPTSTVTSTPTPEITPTTTASPTPTVLPDVTPIPVSETKSEILYRAKLAKSVCTENCRDSSLKRNCINNKIRHIKSLQVSKSKKLIIKGVAGSESITCFSKPRILASLKQKGSSEEILKDYEIQCNTRKESFEITFNFDDIIDDSNLDISLTSGDWCAFLYKIIVISNTVM